MKKPRTKADIYNHPLVTELWNEGEDGWWCSLKTGNQWCGYHTIHEYTIKDICDGLMDVEPCECKDCKGEPYFDVYPLFTRKQKELARDLRIYG